MPVSRQPGLALGFQVSIDRVAVLLGQFEPWRTNPEIKPSNRGYYGPSMGMRFEPVLIKTDPPGH
ncbi:MAG TPA: hypothetical protein VH684_04425 [Xanthobacteraceae bacterium]